MSLVEAVNPSSVSDLHAKAMRHLEEKSKEAMSFIEMASGPEFPGAKVATLEGHQSEVSFMIKNSNSIIIIIQKRE